MANRRSESAELIGRREERARIDALLDGARLGRSGALVVTGEPGIGKSVLLRYATDHAGGMAVLKATGVESESELPFAALADLLGPALGQLSALPEPQAAALAGALAVGPPAAGGRFAVCAATMGLLAAFAETGPVLGVVDEAHWLDVSSLEAMLFTARRLDAEGIVLLFAAREPEGESLARAGLEQLRLDGFAASEAAALISRSLERTPSLQVVDGLVDATGGNPLALVEIPTLLTDAQLAGDEPIAEDLALTPLIEQALLSRLGAVSDEARRALVVAAAADLAKLDDVEAAVRWLGIDPVALAEAEDAGVVRADGDRIEFRHPLLRSAIYNAAPGALRRDAIRQRLVADFVAAAH